MPTLRTSTKRDHVFIDDVEYFMPALVTYTTDTWSGAKFVQECRGEHVAHSLEQAIQMGFFIPVAKETPVATDTPKYAVFKWDDYKAILEAMRSNGMGDGATHVECDRIKDAEVIRHQDISSPAILGLYSHIVAALGESLQASLSMDYEEKLQHINELRRIGDHFDDAAAKAESIAHKLPD